jgi:hypothetical protein
MKRDSCAWKCVPPFFGGFDALMIRGWEPPIFRASYVDGEMAPSQKGGSTDPKPCAGNDGTTITVRSRQSGYIRLDPYSLYMRALRQRTCSTTCLRAFPRSGAHPRSMPASWMSSPNMPSTMLGLRSFAKRLLVPPLLMFRRGALR